MLTDLMRQLAAGAAAGSQAELLFGLVKTESPLTVTVDQRLTLPEEALLLTEEAEELRLRVRHNLTEEPSLDREYLLRPGLKTGDQVILLSAGGQYLVLGRIGTPGRSQVVE